MLMKRNHYLVNNMTCVIDKTGWKTFKKRAIFPVFQPNRLYCEDEAIRECIEAAGIQGFVPQDITVTRDDEYENAISNMSVECRPDKDVSGKVLCMVNGPERTGREWYDLDEING